MPQSPDTYVDKTYDQVLRDRNRRSSARGVSSPDRGGPCWWPEQVDVSALTRPAKSPDPFPADFDYAAEFATLDLAEVAAEIDAVLTTSQEWWPADYGHYGPLILRMAWHLAGTYRVCDGRGGAAAGLQRFAPLNSWPDNRNLDKARRLLWPVKQKYGRKLSWADLLVFAGNRALESMGLPTLGFAGGREEVWGPDETYWGPEDTWFADERHTGVRDLQEPLAASEMGLIYVDPQGPATLADPINSARDIRQTFARMGFNDEETVALIAGGHTFGKTHGVADPACLGPEPEAAPMSAMGLGWLSSHGCGRATDTVTSGLEGIWTPTPTTWDNSFFETLFSYEWDAVLSPAGLWQWVPSNGDGAETIPDPHDPDRRHAPTMLTTDLALQEDRRYEVIARRFLEDHEEFTATFARAWFKLTHLDLGPRERYLGSLVPPDQFLWQDPVPPPTQRSVDEAAVNELKHRVSQEITAGVFTVSQLVRTAWAAASTYRDSDKRGGANGGRIRLEPQRSWDVNEPDQLGIVLAGLERLRTAFQADSGAELSMADLIVLAGCAAVEVAAERAGVKVSVPFTPGRTDAVQADTDPEWFSHLEPRADGFRNFPPKASRVKQEHLLIDRARQLTLTPPEMTVLVGGLRVLGGNHGDSPLGVLTTRPGTLSTDFFVNLLDPDIEWSPSRADGQASRDAGGQEIFDGRDRASGAARWSASRCDLVFGSHAQLRAICEYYASDDAAEMFVDAFVAAWHKVMMLDRF